MRYLVLVESNCRETGREAEFEEWYDTVHVPDILAEPGTVSVSRWVDDSPPPGRGRYYTLVEIETDDLDRTLTRQRENAARLAAAGRLSDLFSPVSRRVLKKNGR